MDTKRRIRQAALDMFAKNGYQAVSIRDICGAVGVKESTIYFHYKNKRDIFGHLLNDVHQHMDAMRERFDDRFQSADRVTEDEFVAVALNLLHNFFLSEPIGKFIDMLSIERLSNPAAARTYRKLVFDLPIEQQAHVFEEMRKKGIFAATDCQSLAREYHYAVYGAYMNGLDDEALAELIRRIYRRERAQ